MSVSLSLLASTALACASGACALIPQHEPSKAFNNVPENYSFSRVVFEYTGEEFGDVYSSWANIFPELTDYIVCNVSLPDIPGDVVTSNFRCCYDPSNQQYHLMIGYQGSLLENYPVYNDVYWNGVESPSQASSKVSFLYNNDYLTGSKTSGVYHFVTGVDTYFGASIVHNSQTDETNANFNAYNPFRDGTSWVDNIGVGFGIIPNLGTAINTGLDSMFYTDGVISKTATFAFTLMGIGISVGVVSLVFKWLTGRHGM